MNEEKQEAKETKHDETKAKEPKQEAQAEKKKDKPKKLSKTDKLQQEIDTLKEENAQLNDKLLRNSAELQNFKRRMNEERIKDRKFANEDVFKALLPILDNFAIALANEKDKSNAKALKGFEMIYKNMLETLESQGLSTIDALDQPFDPSYHQAVMKESKDGVEAGIVIEEFQKGYIYKDRLLRPAMVKVSE